MAETIAATIAVRRDTAANFATVGYVPALGEPVAVIDGVTGQVTSFLIGDGVSLVAALPSLVGGGSGGGTVNLPYDSTSETYLPQGTPAIPSIDPSTSLLSPATMTALDARYAVSTGAGVQAWAPSTAYAAGAPVITPSGDFATALTAFTSASTFNAANWRIDAPTDSPAFTGNPTAPTPPTTDNDTTVATTAYVQALFATVASTFGMATVGWNATTKAWAATTRPSVVGPVMLVSTDDPTATQPSWMAVGDCWIQHPDAAS